MKRIVFIMLCVIFIVFNFLNAKSGPIKKGNFQLDFSPGVLKVYQNYLFIGGYEHFNVYDISNPETPTLLKKYTNISAKKITLSNNLMITIVNYVGPDEFYIIDAHDFNNLKIYYKLDYTNSNYETIFQAAIYGNFLIMTVETKDDYKKKVVVYDISNPSNPVLKNEIEFFGIGGIYADDNYLYLIGEKEDNGDYGFTPHLYIYEAKTLPNLSNLIGKVEVNVCCGDNVKKVDNYIFITDMYYLGIVDITNINQPKYIGRVSGSYIGGSYFYNNFLYTVDQWGAGGEIFKIVPDGDPVLLTAFQPLAGYIIEGKDNYIYIVENKDENYYVDIFDVSNPIYSYWKDTITAKKLIPGNWVFNGQYSGNDYILIHLTTSFSNKDYIEVINVKTKEVTDYFDKNSKYDINLLGRIGDVNLVQKDNLVLFEKINENGKLSAVSSINLGEKNIYIGNIWSGDNLLFVSVYPKKIKIYNISDIKNPQIVKSLDDILQNYYTKGVYYNNYIYLVDGIGTANAALKIFNLNADDNGTYIYFGKLKNEFYKTYTENLQDLALYNSFLFLVTRNTDNKTLNLYVYSLENPAEPVLNKKIENFSEGEAQRAYIKIFNNYLFVWDDKKIWLFDISNSTTPLLKGSIYIPSIKNFDIDPKNSYIYVSSYNANGVVKIDFKSLLKYLNGDSQNVNKITLNLKGGWNLVGIPIKVEYTPQVNGKWKTIWVWNKSNKKWLVLGGNDEINKLLEKYGLQSIETIHWTEGFWIYALESFNIDFDNINQGYELSDLKDELVNGWNLVGCGGTWNISNFPNYITMVWKYNNENKKWEIGTNNDSIKKLLKKYGIIQIQEIYQGNGAWFYVENK